MEALVNQQIKLPFVSSGLATGLTSFSPIFLSNGTVVSVAPTFTEIGSGVYTVNFTPVSTGEWSVFVAGSIQAQFTTVAKTLSSTLQSLTDEALGSWAWNKSTGALTLYKNDSSVLATYSVVDTVQNASRERLS